MPSGGANDANFAARIEGGSLTSAGTPAPAVPLPAAPELAPAVPAGLPAVDIDIDIVVDAGVMLVEPEVIGVVAAALPERPALLVIVGTEPLVPATEVALAFGAGLPLLHASSEQSAKIESE
jgi:hypothetical protein